MIDRKATPQHSGSARGDARYLAIFAALAALCSAVVVAVPTFSDGAVQPLQTERGQASNAAEASTDDSADAEESALVVDVGGDQSVMDLGSFGSKAEPKKHDGDNRSNERSKGRQSDSKRKPRGDVKADAGSGDSGSGDNVSTDEAAASATTTTAAGSPTTAAPTTAAAAPITAAPTTAAPTTAAAAPTTAAPTTAAPTTAAPTTAAPTTAAPTTAAPTTAPPPPPPSGNLSSQAIRVGFENHPLGGPYNTARQELDPWSDIRWGRHWTDRSRIVDNPTVSGSHALQILYPGGGHNGGAYAVFEIPPRQEYYLSYYVYFKPGFDFEAQGNSGGKLPGLAAGDLCSGGKTCDGTNGFTARYMWREEGRAQLYLYDMDRDTGWGREVYFKSGGRDFYFETGRWHRLVQRVRTNTTGRSDGQVDVWMNGQQVIDLDGLRFQTNGQMIDVFFFSTFFGGGDSSWEPKWDSYTYFDDIVVSPNRSDVGL